MIYYKKFKFQSPRLKEIAKLEEQFGGVYEPRARVFPALAAHEMEVAKEEDRILRGLDRIFFHPRSPCCPEHYDEVIYGSVPSTFLAMMFREGENVRYDRRFCLRKNPFQFCLTCVEEAYRNQILGREENLCHKSLFSEDYWNNLESYRNKLAGLKRGILCDGLEAI